MPSSRLSFWMTRMIWPCTASASSRSIRRLVWGPKKRAARLTCLPYPAAGKRRPDFSAGSSQQGFTLLSLFSISKTLTVDPGDFVGSNMKTTLQQYTDGQRTESINHNRNLCLVVALLLLVGTVDSLFGQGRT